jgi:quercetin dioxygenase-like cupin family protein
MNVYPEVYNSFRQLRKEIAVAIPHARSGEVVSVRPLGKRLADARTETLVKTDALEIIRLVAPAGKEFAKHEVPGEITLQCLEGVIELSVGASKRQLSAGDLAYVEGSAPHAVRAVEDASVLLTILLFQKAEV